MAFRPFAGLRISLFGPAVVPVGRGRAASSPAPPGTPPGSAAARSSCAECARWRSPGTSGASSGRIYLKTNKRKWKRMVKTMVKTLELRQHIDKNIDKNRHGHIVTQTA